ncbi:tetratricopeptide repeat protein [Okeania sp.]|uniref:tetratricopeptide repeat protein n=1 Tax=Okeania sp. TaxID=3100323 RepID=UPI002B4B6019|nr:tetratricopeptide repeat protein [Okeania sp.]MEB3341627.1 tetratricopeptide repeat protein [Okeania sp.]
MSASDLLKQANKLKREGRLDEAIALYNQAIELNPHFSWIYYYLGECLEKTGYLEAAAQNYLQATELNKNSAFMQYKYGKVIKFFGNEENGANLFLSMLKNFNRLPLSLYQDLFAYLKKNKKYNQLMSVISAISIKDDECSRFFKAGDSFCQSKKKAIIIAADYKFVKGIRALLYSLKTNSPSLLNHDVLLLTDEPYAFENNSFIKQNTSQIIEINTDNYSNIDTKKFGWHPRFVKSFYSFEAFKDWGYDVNIFLDADTLCLSNIDFLFQNKGYKIMAALDIGINVFPRIYKCSHYIINTGVMCIDKCLFQYYERLLEIASKGISYDGGDQGVINHLLYEQNIKVSYLHPKFNTLKRIYHHFPSIWAEIEPKIIHYVGDKPWNGSEGGYEKLEEIWRTYYNLSLNKPATTS